MKITIDLEQGAEIFQSIGKLMRLRERQKNLMQEMAMSIIHHKAVLDKADPEKYPSALVLDEKGLIVLRHVFRLASNPEYRERLSNYSTVGKKYKLTQELGTLAAQTTTDDDWESFTVQICIPNGKLQEITLNTQHAKFIIQYLVPKMFHEDVGAWYKSRKLKPWEENV